MQEAVHLILMTLIAHVISQVIKYHTSHGKSYLCDGGMPSVHATTVCATMTGIYLFEGLSPLFVLSLLLALIVMHDSMNIRREVGLHAAYLNKKKDHTRFSEETGHTIWQVVAGIALGVVCASAYHFLIL